jgi:hypothetical protein
MKRALLSIAIAAFLITTFPSCATVLGGPVSECQRTKPAAGQPSRKVRAGALIADIILIPVIGLIVDFSTGAIYKPCDAPKQETSK